MSNIAILFVLFFVLLAAFLVFDQLVRLEYNVYRSKWEADGKPHGFFWVPPESKALSGWIVKGSSTFARNHRALSWLFSTPEWIQQNANAKRLLYLLRLFVITWNVSILIVLATTFCNWKY
jgi:hypothetical protein